MLSITSLVALPQAAPTAALPNAPSLDPSSSTPGGFGSLLSEAVSRAGGLERASDDAGQRFAAGDPSVGIHEVMIASEKSSIALRFAVTLKNKAIEAYRELMSTPL